MGAKRKRHPSTVNVERLERTIALALMNVAQLDPTADDSKNKRNALAELVHGLAPLVPIWDIKAQ